MPVEEGGSKEREKTDREKEVKRSNEEVEESKKEKKSSDKSEKSEKSDLKEDNKEEKTNDNKKDDKSQKSKTEKPSKISSKSSVRTAVSPSRRSKNNGDNSKNLRDDMDPIRSATRSPKPKSKKQKPVEVQKSEKSPLDWVISIIYIICVWSIGAAVMAIILYFMLRRVADKPLYFGYGSFIGGTPNIVFEPNPAAIDPTKKAHISFAYNDTKTFMNYLVRFKKILQEYSPEAPPCTVSGKVDGRLTSDTCSMDLQDDSDQEGYGPCALTETSITEGMGYDEKRPCVMLRLSRILGYFPVLKDDNNTKACETCCKDRRIVFTCKGANYTMYPAKGIDTCNFPYWNQPNYNTPFVMMQFNLTNVAIECESNIKPHDEDEQTKNVVKFEFTV